MSISPRTLRPSAFSPRSISGLALWLDASDSGSTYTTDAGPVVAVNDPLDIAGCALWLDGADATSITASGGEVTAWADKSASALSFTAAGTPVTGSHTLNGRNVIRFDNVADLLSATSATRLGITSSYTVFTVARYTTVQTSMLMSIGRSVSPNTNGLTLYYNAGLRTIEKRDAAWGTDMVVSGSLATANAALLATGTRSGTDQRIMRDGMLAGSTAGSTGNIAWGDTTVLIGNTFEGTFLGDIAEIIAYPTALTTAQRASVEAYLAAKWGISGVHAPATASSDPVGYWGDKSGNGRHVTTSDASTRPVIHSATHNGRKVLDFDGVNDTLSRDNYTAENDLTGLTRFGVFYADVGSGAVHVSSVYSGGSYSSFTSASSLLGTHAGLSSSSRHDNVGNILTSGTSPRVFCARYDGTAGSFAAGLNIIMDGVTLPVASTTGTFPSSLPGGSPSLFIGSNIRANNWLNGKLCEYISYARALTTAERKRVERYLATRWGITLAPQVSNADAQNWIDRVYANGGSVSSATAGAVNSLCDSLDASGVRPLMYRMGIFAGSNLNAALVPLYRGPSLGGTQYGGATDTNVGGLFVSGDYNETGASGGLANAARTKHLDTGFATNTLSAGNRHLSAYARTWPNTSFDEFLGSENPFLQNQFVLGHQSAADTVSFQFGGNTNAISSGVISSGAMWLGVESSLAVGVLYRNGVSAANGTLTAASPTSASILVFANNRASNPSPVDLFGGTLGGYSIGLSMDAGQAAAYNTAMQSFQAALTRNV